MTRAASLSPRAKPEALSGSEAVTSARTTPQAAHRSLDSLVLIAPPVTATGGFYEHGQAIDARQRACSGCGESCWTPLSLAAHIDVVCIHCIPERATALLSSHITTEEVLYPHDDHQ